MSERLMTDSRSERIQKLIATKVLELSGYEVTLDGRSLVQIAIDGVESGVIDEAMAVNEGLILPEAE